MRRKIRDEADARACIEAVRASGLAASEWARSSGVDGRSLRAWTLNLERSAGSKSVQRSARKQAAPLRLVELMPSRPPPTSLARYVVRIGVHSVELDAYFDETSLRRLLLVLTSC